MQIRDKLFCIHLTTLYRHVDTCRHFYNNMLSLKQYVKEANGP